MEKLLIVISIFFVTALAHATEPEYVLWHPENKAVAFCDTKANCYIVVSNQVIDVSHVTNSNIGKLGNTSRTQYEKVISFPVKWLKHSKNEHMVSFKTQAWLNGQRYTVDEPVYVKNGKYLQR